MIYVALLRGVNVGGKNRVNMAELKTSFEALGFESVKTYINSGNVLFWTSEPRRRLPELIQERISADFSVDIKVLLKSQPEIEALVSWMPDDWVNDELYKSDVMFLWPEVNEPGVIDQLSWDPGNETVRYLPGVILWHTTKAFAPKSKVLKINTLPLYKSITLRNPNTVRKLLRLMRELR